MSGSKDEIDYGIKETPWESLDYGSQFSQYARFNVIRKLGIREGDSLFDIGSGLSELKRFFDLLNIEIVYSGCEPNKELFENRYGIGDGPYAPVPVLNMTFEEAYEKVMYSESQAFDWYVCCGVYAEDKYTMEDVLNAVQKVYKLAKKGLVFTFLSDDHTGKVAHKRYFSPSTMFHEVKTLINGMGHTPRLVLRYDYLPHSFALYLYKGQQAWVRKYKEDHE